MSRALVIKCFALSCAFTWTLKFLINGIDYLSSKINLHAKNYLKTSWKEDLISTKEADLSPHPEVQKLKTEAKITCWNG